MLDPGILENHAIASAKCMSGNLGDGFSVYRNTSTGDVIETHQQVDKSCLATTGRAYDGNPSARLCVKVKSFDERFVLFVAEGNIPDIHCTFYIDKSSGRIRAFRLFLQKIKDPGSAGQSVLKLCDHGADIVEGLHILVCISQQYGKSTDSQMTARDQKGTCKSYTCVNDVVDTSCGRVGEAAVKNSLLAGITEFFIDRSKTFGRTIFVTKGLNHFLISDHFLDQCSLTSTGITLRTEHLEGMGGDEFRHKKAYRCQNNDHQSDPHIFGEHEEQGSDDGDDTGKQLCKSKEHTIGKNIRICDDTADDITGAVSVQVGQRKLLDMADGSCTDILYCAVGHTVVDDTHDPGGNAGKYDHDKNTGKIESHSCKINFVGSNDLINGITKKYGNIQLQNYSDCSQDHT